MTQLGYPVVKAMVDDLCEVAKREMKEKNDGDLGSWRRAVTTADGTWQTRGTVRMPLSLLESMVHSCITTTSGRDKGDLYPGTSKSAEGYAAFQGAKEEGMDVAIHWPSSAKAVREIFPRAEIMLCGGHAGRAHRKILH